MFYVYNGEFRIILYEQGKLLYQFCGKENDVIWYLADQDIQLYEIAFFYCI